MRQGGCHFRSIKHIETSHLVLDRCSAGHGAKVGNEPGSGMAAKAGHSREKGQSAIAGVQEVVPSDLRGHCGTVCDDMRHKRRLAFSRRFFDQTIVRPRASIQHFGELLDGPIKGFFVPH